MRWNKEQYAEYLRRQASGAKDKSKATKPERPIRNEPLGASQGEEGLAPRIRVSVEGRRIRLLDPDNACPKQAVDCARYAGLIPNDRPQDIELVITQTKVATRAEECTVITIERLEK